MHLIYPETGMLPPEDRQRSPLTGWTRVHWEAIADALLEGVRPYASRHQALILVPDSQSVNRGRRSHGLAGYARTFLLAAFRLAGSASEVPGDLAGRYAAGLKAGTDPTSREAWPRITDVSRAMVEAAFIAVGLHVSRPWIWDRLSDAERARVVAWLSGVHGKKFWLNNWLLFQVIVNAFLKSVCGPYRQEDIDRGLDLVDSWYQRDGWYTDGPGSNYDYYVGWAIHFYTMMWCRIEGDGSDPSRATIYRQRIRRYLEQYRLLFAANGAPLYHGRSLTYRFACVAPLWTGALLDATPLSPGETRRIASGALRHFVERGAIQNGLLTRGWYHQFLPMLQRYSGPGSQYWASKAFLGLLLPSTHPVWTAREEPMPVERGDFRVAMPGPGFVVRGTRADGIIRVASHRSDRYPQPVAGLARLKRAAAWTLQVMRAGHLRPALGPDDPHYRKLAYSTHAAPDLDRRGDDLDIDSQVTLLRDGGTSSRRVRLYPIAIVDRFAASVFYPNEPNWSDRVETVSIARGAAEIRIHHVRSNSFTGVRDGGFAIADSAAPVVATGARWSMASRSNGLTSFIGGLHGFETSHVSRSEAANPFGHHSATPYLTARLSTSAEAVYVSLVVITGERFEPGEALADIGAVQVSGRQVLVSCRDGEFLFVQMVAPEPVDLPLGPVRLRGGLRFARVSPDGTMFTHSD